MALVDLDQFDEFWYALINLGRNMMEQDAFNEEISETLIDIIDEYAMVEPTEENDIGPLAVDTMVEPEYEEIVENNSEAWIDPAMEHVRTHYLDDFREIHGLNEEEVREALINNIAFGVRHWDAFNYVEPYMTQKEIEEGKKASKAIKELLNANRSRE